MNETKIKELLRNNEIIAKKKYGQNFLINDNLLDKIAGSLGRGNSVIEIGPGLGSLTEYLLKYYQKVLAYEIDKDMINILKWRFDDRLILINQDFLNVSIDSDILNYLETNNQLNLISNLPYYITTPILIKILEESKRIKNITIMVQKEVGERLLGKVNTKEYNSLSVLIQTYMEVNKLLNVSKNEFYPKPLVDSMVLVLKRREKPLWNIENEDHFKKINRLLFSQRRKTIINNLKNCYDKEILITMLQELNINLLARSEELGVKEIIDISNYLFKRGI